MALLCKGHNKVRVVQIDYCKPIPGHIHETYKESLKQTSWSYIIRGDGEQLIASEVSGTAAAGLAANRMRGRELKEKTTILPTYLYFITFPVLYARPYIIN